ncbi:MAG TPA: SAM-dependent chlorinase/fluorinase [bacterium]|nr:SAM-dependent chlorinase/fluorinase [bacterium]HPQ65556.1 SAM-dependent chlorinase/fluorinase [bacterium]
MSAAEEGFGVAADRIITLLTDFGARDWFVGSMKGVILSREPRAKLVDITHEIAPGNVREGAFVLMNAWRWFPPGTLHLVVVDPGVGTSRPIIAARGAGHLFLGPDNGVLSWALEGISNPEVRRLDPGFAPPSAAPTFHGRDIFAPAAAALIGAGAFETCGPPSAPAERLDFPVPSRSGSEWTVEVLHIDRFGNVVTSFPAERLGELGPSPAVEGIPVPVRESYGFGEEGELMAVAGSAGFLELAVRGGSARDRLGTAPGARLVLSGPRRA